MNARDNKDLEEQDSERRGIAVATAVMLLIVAAAVLWTLT